MTNEIGDEKARYANEERTLRYSGYRDMIRYSGVVTTSAGPLKILREVYEIGGAAAVLPYDPERDLLVLQRQFRMGPEIMGKPSIMIEIAAGMMEDGESPLTCAIRETEEELGITPRDLIHALDFMPSTGWTSEVGHLFIGRVDSATLPKSAGAAGESEFTEPFAVSPEAAIRAMDEGRILNAYTIIALSWFARHRARIRGQWGFAP